MNIREANINDIEALNRIYNEGIEDHCTADTRPQTMLDTRTWLETWSRELPGMGLRKWTWWWAGYLSHLTGTEGRPLTERLNSVIMDGHFKAWAQVRPWCVLVSTGSILGFHGHLPSSWKEIHAVSFHRNTVFPVGDIYQGGGFWQGRFAAIVIMVWFCNNVVLYPIFVFHTSIILYVRYNHYLILMYAVSVWRPSSVGISTVNQKGIVPG